MGKKDKKGAEEANSAPQPPKETKKNTGIEGGIHFDSSDSVSDNARKQVNLEHITKPWTRDTWERARPWILEQRQKLEGLGWSNVDGARTELFVLKKNAPHGSFTEDGSIYIRVPKKFIDFNRSGKTGGDEGGAEEGGEGEEGEKKKKKPSRVSKKKENAPSYELNDPLVWKIKVENAESDDPERIPSVVLDLPEPMENIMYMVMTLQPGLIRLHAARKNVVQPGTKQSATRDDAETPTVRHTAMVASSEAYTRTLPPAYWFKRNMESLQKILNSGEEGKEYEHTLAAAENVQRAVTRDCKDVEERTWEEKIGGEKGGDGAANATPATAAATGGAKKTDRKSVV